MHYYLMLLLIGCGFLGKAQMLLVTDKPSGNPIEFVYVFCDSTQLMKVTNAEGQVDISGFEHSQKIVIQALGYKTLETSYKNIQAKNFSVALSPLEILLEEIVVSAYQPDTLTQTSIHIEPLLIEQIEQNAAFTLADALTQVPGVTQLSTGIGISKPVIRGLYGNRILVLFSGLRFDNQQWQDEHGLGLSSMGIQSVEVIKGPLAVLYGTEAVGGVVNILEENPCKSGTITTDFSNRFHSNTLGNEAQFGFKKNTGKYWLRLRVAHTSHSDYANGNNERVLNCRFYADALKASYGFQRKNWISQNHYYFSMSKFGFILGDPYTVLTVDDRFEKSIPGPHHNVLLNAFSSLNTLQLQHSKLVLNTGIQSNLRSEDEGGGELSLKMHLLNGQYNLKWHRSLSKNLQLIVAHGASLETNENYGKRKIVPDALVAEGTFSGYLKKSTKKIIWEVGAGLGNRYIQTFETATVNTDDKEITPFNQNRPFYNGMLGVSYLASKNSNFKLNISSGVRSPNLAELSSDGLHEGVYTYEIGDPTMKNERNWVSDLGWYFVGKQAYINIAGFFNQFQNYIYLEPTSEEWFGFPVYRYKQYNAQIYGGEAAIGTSPNLIKWAKASVDYSGLIGKLTSNTYLPFMPAQRLKPQLRLNWFKKGQTTFYFKSEWNIVFAQNLNNPMESKSPGYQLWNFGWGGKTTHKKLQYSWNINLNNTFNQAYCDHLSRFKNYDLLNIGRNLSVMVKINFIQSLKTN